MIQEKDFDNDSLSDLISDTDSEFASASEETETLPGHFSHIITDSGYKRVAHVATVPTTITTITTTIINNLSKVTFTRILFGESRTPRQLFLPKLTAEGKEILQRAYVGF